MPDAARDLALSIVRERYRDFGPTLAEWMIADALRVDRRHSLPCPPRTNRVDGASVSVNGCGSMARSALGNQAALMRPAAEDLLRY